MNTRRMIIFAAGLMITAAPVSAQMQIVGYGAAEWDLEDVSVYVLGVALQTTRLGWGPAFNIMGYTVQLPDGSAINRISAINPSIGLQYRQEMSAFQARVGYAFVDADNAITGLPAYGGAESGMTTTVQYNNWGTGTRSFEGIANMNWADQYAWARARATQRIAGGIDATAFNVGAEAGIQGNDSYRAVQVGPIVEVAFGAVKLLGGVGYKFQDTYPDTPYFRAEFVLVR